MGDREGGPLAVAPPTRSADNALEVEMTASSGRGGTRSSNLGGSNWVARPRPSALLTAPQQSAELASLKASLHSKVHDVTGSQSASPSFAAMALDSRYGAASFVEAASFVIAAREVAATEEPLLVEEKHEGEDEEDKAATRARSRRTLRRLYILVALMFFAHEMTSTTKVMFAKNHFGGGPAASAASAPYQVVGVIIIIFVAPFWGAFSDSFGRKATLLLAVIPYACSRGSLALWGADGIPLYLVADNLLIIGANEPALMAMIADLTRLATPQERAKAFGVIHGIIPLLKMTGGIIGAEVAERYGGRTACLLSTLSFLLFGVLVGIALPESLPPSMQATWRWSQACTKASPFGSLHLLSQYRAQLGLLFAAYAIAMAVFVGSADIVDQYLVWRYKFNNEMLAVTEFGVFGLCAGLSAVLCTFLVGQIGAKWTVVVGFTLTTFGQNVLAAAPPHANWAWAAMCMFGLGQLWKPAFSAIAAAYVRPEQQGALQGALKAFSSLIGFPMPIVFSQLFLLTSQSVPGGVWLVAAGCNLCAVMLAWTFANSSPTEEAEETPHAGSSAGKAGRVGQH